MPFLFKPYRSTRSTWEVLARLRHKLLLSKQPLLFFSPRDRNPPRGLSHSPFLCPLGVVVPSTPCCFSLCSLSRFSVLIALSLVAVLR
jgi:hypothetical protein